MRFVDAHVHLSDKDYEGQVDEVVAEAKKANVVALVSNSVDLKTSIGCLKLAEDYPSMVFAALGIHPWNVQTLTEGELQQAFDFISKHGDHRALVAIGEIGLDIKYEKIWDKQMMVFDRMLNLAGKLDLPVIIHSRGTTTRIVDMLPSYSLKKVLLHWFSAPISILSKIVENGYYISEGPPVAYSNGIRDVIRKTPLANLMTETDGPVRFFRKPFEGKRTTPAYIPTIIKAMAEIKNMSVEETADWILKNFEEFYEVKLN